MKENHKRAAILFGVLAVIAILILFINASFGKGLLLGLLLAAIIYILRSFLPKRQ
ncbi:hypothetical protein DSM03_10641 [Leeuwenhoekiella aestuarii]|uniref:Uncharacterized protein n=2 Tax=Leeuwenhoekiella TaxID=283735 RepID=A0A4Q0NPI9_9FLAO|nr:MULTISPECIES: hypothetical protein [Leeuwenhoekiella]RXG12271.1 hypothetical protein DSM04_10741 [Leeuwenhoekiella aestuarii]RXG13704.1 hypothetical protein DSM03_10641 [Leeuwenhoekiella aestuarii]RXG25116.1 hypothetical protein DSM02_1085 [Leeuwenhoekiella polynyae]|tara:strand:- start:187 stop:351 length:165 start_codon:yes stop_codon:yes gene_type:complete